MRRSIIQTAMPNDIKHNAAISECTLVVATCEVLAFKKTSQPINPKGPNHQPVRICKAIVTKPQNPGDCRQR